MLQPHELREKRITKMLCIVIAVLYLMVNYNSFKKGFAEGFSLTIQLQKMGTKLSSVPTWSSMASEEILLNKSVQ